MNFQPSIASSNQSSSSDGSDTSDNNDAPCIDNEYSAAKAEVHKAMKGEDRGVFWSRLVVKVTKIIVAVTLTVVTFKQLKRAEQNEFHEAFLGYCDMLQSFTEKEFAAQFEAMKGLSDVLLTYSLASVPEGDEVPWPLFTVPSHHFEALAKRVVSLPHEGIVWFAPLVNDVTLWNNYCNDEMAGNGIPMGPNMFALESAGTQLLLNGTGIFTPIHQVYPQPKFIDYINGSIINYDTSSDLSVNASLAFAYSSDHVVLGEIIHDTLIRDSYPEVFDAAEPISMLTSPIHSTYDEQSSIVGYVQRIFTWKSFFSKFDGVSHSCFCNVENSCGGSFTLLVDDHNVTHIDSKYIQQFSIDEVSVTWNIGMSSENNTLAEATEMGICLYTLTVYPTTTFRQSYDLQATLYAVAVGLTMLFMLSTFFAYDYFVTRRNNKMIKSVVQSSAIVASMFPSNVRARLYKEQENVENRRKQHGNLASYLNDGENGSSGSHDKPLADLFTETTVLFADIAGFTAWSSMRQPCQVFILLETIYGAFDAIAKRRRIFKIETIGDCYVAVAGIPEPMTDHAVAMCKFANDILATMQTLTRQMESSLGPDTGDLALRVGLHSGPVTAGVLRGERARFQLFGDTMNTAARMEQTGMKNRIQLSDTTAGCLHDRGKSHWTTLRDEKVVAKGKGELVTYWLEVKPESYGKKSAQTSDTSSVQNSPDVANAREQVNALKAKKSDRLVDWNSEVMCQLLQKVIANRVGTASLLKMKDNNDMANSLEKYTNSTTKPLDEVKECISFPHTKKMKSSHDKTVVAVSSEVANQLREYVSCIAEMYNNSEFHNFEHASHVMMSVTKLLSRIKAPHESVEFNSRDFTAADVDLTCGIASDPLTQFACVFSALIHDVGHAGVPNTQLVKNNIDLSSRYGCKSVAEQNSIDIAWALLMKDEYKELLTAICATNSELLRFRQIVVNAVLATDIVDTELKSIRDMRWAKSFPDDDACRDMTTHLGQKEMIYQANYKATVVIEHMIQASSLSYTMQHWHIYRKWNECLYFECYDAYRNGHSVIDPTDSWYQNELDFFDLIVIPLARKLKQCGIFGVSGVEYLQYAMSNRSEWQTKGQQSVAAMKDRVNEKFER